MAGELIPAGTVTFLFSDIEGSTKLWESHPDTMRVSLARHDALMREAMTASTGYIFKTMGDAFCVAFATAAEALEAVLSAQLALASEPWPEETPIRVRMALHTGAVESRNDDYFGPPVNRVARLLGTAHGGQIIVSAVTQELIRDDLPVGTSLRSLGEHRLKDLGRPESVFQLVDRRLADDFPPLRSLDNPELKHNLPQQVTSFVGREAQISEVKGLMEKTRLLTLTGSGGSGKTRLALQVAAEMLDGSGDGVWLVELAALTDPSLVAFTVASILGVKEDPGKPILQTLTEQLKDKFTLLILDNCEHVLDACAKLADALLRNCPRILILATSREALGISGEQTYRVPSLSLPDPKQAQTPETLSQYESVRLFVDRAVLAKSDFQVTNQNAPALASICHRLDGIPLAIELAAARVRSLTIEDINAKLDQRFRLLTGGSRTALPRQQTLRSLIDWSYDLLDVSEKALLCRLSVFAGGWNLESAEAVCAGGSVEEWETLDLLTSLCDKSLIVAETTGTNVRYQLLETVRQYARDRLLEGGEAAALRDRHRDWCVTLVERAGPELVGPNQAVWEERLVVEHDNLREGLKWCEDDPSGGVAGLRLCAWLWRFWIWRESLKEGRERCATALAHPGAQKHTLARARTLNGAGNLALVVRDWNDAQAMQEQALSLSRELSDLPLEASTLNSLAILAIELGDHERARGLLEEAVELSRKLGDRNREATALDNLGVLLRRQGEYSAAQRAHEAALEISRELAAPYGLANSLLNVGITCYELGEYAEARSHLEQALAMYRELGLGTWEAYDLCYLGSLATAEGNLVQARSLLQQALRLSCQFDRTDVIVRCLEGLAVVESVGQPQLAARLWAVADSLRSEFGEPLTTKEQLAHDARVLTARKDCGDATAFDAAWAEGSSLSLEDAIALACKANEV